MKNNLAFFATIVFCFGCCKATSTNSLKISNNTVYSLKIVKYFFGGNERDSIMVKPNSDVMYPFLEVVNNKIVSKEKIIDSIKIVFNNTKYAIHLNGLSNAGNLKSSIPITNIRNILNINSYQKKIGPLLKCTQNTEYTYVFLEQDFLDAK